MSSTPPVTLVGSAANPYASAAAQTNAPLTPRQQLLGQTLPSGWRLDQMLQATPNSSGSNFGTGYIASRGSDVAFIKAVDFVGAMNAADPIVELGKLIGESTFEKDVLQYCANQGMNRVLQYIGHEYIYVGDPTNPLNRVSCLIMEAGDDDLRRLVHKTESNSCSWCLFVLRDVAKAVAQLHKGGIAHQDVKPSNVIAVKEQPSLLGQKSTPMKVGDLGRVVRRHAVGPFDAYPWPGDLRYSPPERWYGHVPQDWNDSREASDAYMLGSLLVFLFTGLPLQTLMAQRLPQAFQPGVWGGAYDSDLVPVILNATVEVFEEVLRPLLQTDIADEVIDIAKVLTHPDPAARGDRKARRQIGRPVGIDRIYQRLELLAGRCAAIERGKALA